MTTLGLALCPGLRARDERLLPAEAARRRLGTTGARSAPASKRRRALSLQSFAVGWLVAAEPRPSRRRPALHRCRSYRPSLSAGLVFLAVLAERFFGFRLGRRQWTGLVITAVGLAIIGISQGAQPSEPPGYALAALIGIEGGILLVHESRRDGRPRPRSPGEGGPATRCSRRRAVRPLGHSAQFLTHAVQNAVPELLSPWVVAALAASVIAFYASARASQIGPESRSSRSPRWRPTSSRSSAASWSFAIRSDRDSAIAGR